MKRYLKYFLSLFALILILSGVPMIGAQATEVNGGSGADGNKTPSTSLGAGSLSQYKSGILCYITSGHMNTLTKVVFIPYSQIPNYSTLTTNNLRARDFTGDSSIEKYPRTLQQVIKGYSGIDWNTPPYTVSQGTGSGNAFKAHFLTVPDPSQPNTTYAHRFIADVFGIDKLMEMEANPDDYYLILETVTWHGEHKDSVMNKAATAPHVWNAFGTDPSRWGYSVDAKNVPHSMYLTDTWYIMEKVTPKWGQCEAVDDLMSPIHGWGIIMVKLPSDDTPTPVVPETPPVITVTNTHDYLRSNELNYIFPDIKKDSSAMRAEDTYDDADFGINAEVTSIWQKHTGSDDRNDKIKDSRWYIQESISSDIVNKLGLSNGLFYRNGAGAYFNPSNAVNLKTVSVGSGTQYAGYGYNLTRSVFGDNLVVSDFTSRGDNQAMKSYVKDVLKFAIGHDGVSSNIVMTENTEGQTSSTAKDIYTFTGKVTEYYEHNDKIHHDAEYEDEYGIDKTTGKTIVTGQKKVKDEWWEDNWNSYTEDHTAETRTHEVTHGLFKYTPYTTTTARNTKAGNLLLATGHVGQAYSKVSFASQLSGTLSIYPEVKYEMWYTPSSETWSTPQLKSIYVM